MKLSYILRVIIGKFLVGSLLFNSLSPLLIVAAQKETSQAHSPSHKKYILIKSIGIHDLMHKIVESAIASNMQDKLSAAFLRCYQKTEQQYKTLLITDVIEALPELLQCALTPESTSNAASIMKLLKFTQHHINSIIDSACCSSILDILGNAYDNLTNNESISDLLMEIYTTLQASCYTDNTTRQPSAFTNIASGLDVIQNNVVDCCAEIIETLTIGFSDTFTSLTTINNTLTTCCADIISSITTNVDLSGVYTSLTTIENTLTTCCATLQTTLTSDFATTWTQLTTGFNGTFTALNNLNDTMTTSFQNTWTILSNLNITATVDFVGIYTALESCCQSTWTQLTSLDNTLVNSFQSTWTQLSTGFNNTFTALTNLNDTMTTDFQNSWTQLSTGFNSIFTTLSNLNITITGDFTGVYTALTTCCQTTWTQLTNLNSTLTTAFQGTWTTLNNLNITIIEDFNGLFTALTTCCQGTLTQLTNLNNTMTTDFQSTWTQLTSGFNGTSTALTSLNNTMTTDFQSTWTMLNTLTVTVTGGFTGIYTALGVCCQSTFTQLTNLNNTMVNDFQNTWTILNNLNVTVTGDFTGIYSALGVCCQSTFTQLTSLNNTMVTDFQTTWTQVNAGFNSTFTALAASNCLGTYTMLANFNTTMVNDFQSTWTQLTSGFKGTFTLLNVLVNANECMPTPIIGSTTIASPGTYCVANNFTGSISIASNNVTLDLNGKTITASSGVGTTITVGANTDVIIKNGIVDMTNATGASNAIAASSSNNLQILTMNFINYPSAASSYPVNLSSVTNFIIDKCIFSNNQTFILQCSGTQGILSNSIITNNSGAGGAGAMLNLSVANLLITNVELTNNTNTAAVVGIESNGTSNVIENCLISGNSGISIALETLSANAMINNCTIINNSTISNGIYIDSSYVTIGNCYLANNATAGAIGIQTATGNNNVVIDSCIVQNSPICYSIDGTEIVVKNCVAELGTTGFLAVATATQAVFLNNIATGNTTGFNYTGSSPIITSWAGNYASANTTNYGSSIPPKLIVNIDPNSGMSSNCVPSSWNNISVATTTALSNDCFLNTWTILTSINKTMTTDFQSTWTLISLLAANNCQNTFTVLTTLNNTMTTDFQSTWTQLTAGFNGTFTLLQSTFTALTNITNTMTTDFQNTWTILNNLTATVTGDFTGIYTALATCCQSTFTQLTSISNTMTTDFLSTWTQLTAGFNGTFTLLGTFTALASILNTMTTDFQNTWTMLNNLTVTVTGDFSGIYTALSTCCQSTFTQLTSLTNTMTTDFQSTWTQLTAGFNGTFTAQQGTFTVLASTNNTMINDFQNTWTILGNLNVTVTGDFSGIYTALAICCQSTFTQITSINNTMTTDFQSTWTQLNNLTVTVTGDFTGIYTALATCCQSTFTQITSINNTMTNDFQSTWTQLSSNFNSTFTILAVNGCVGSYTVLTSINNTMTTDFQNTWTLLAYATACSPTPLRIAATISSPGTYCLANNITGSITISSNNVILDLNGYTIAASGSTAAISVGAYTDVTIKNGTIDMTNSTGSYAIYAYVTANLQILHMNIVNYPNVTSAALIYLNSVISFIIDNCQFLNNTNAQIITGSACLQGIISNSVITNNTNPTASSLTLINFISSSLNIRISSVSITNQIFTTAASGIVFGSGCSNNVIENCVFGDNSNITPIIQLLSSQNTVIDNCKFLNCVVTSGSNVGITTNSGYALIKNCFFSNTYIVTSSIAIQTSSAAYEVAIESCIAINWYYGFYIDGSYINVQNCVAINCNYGFYGVQTSTSAAFIDNVVLNSSVDGFYYGGGTPINCSWAGNYANANATNYSSAIPTGGIETLSRGTGAIANGGRWYNVSTTT